MKNEEIFGMKNEEILDHEMRKFWTRNEKISDEKWGNTDRKPNEF